MIEGCSQGLTVLVCSALVQRTPMCLSGTGKPFRDDWLLGGASFLENFAFDDLSAVSLKRP